MSVSRMEAVFAATEGMTNQDAIDYIETNITDEELSSLFDETTDIKIIPGCGYTFQMLRRKEVEDE